MDEVRTVLELQSLGQSINDLSGNLVRQGVGLSEKLDRTTGRVQETLEGAATRLCQSMDRASEATERHAQSLAKATWALVISTIALVAVTGFHAYIAAAAGH